MITFEKKLLLILAASSAPAAGAYVLSVNSSNFLLAYLIVFGLLTSVLVASEGKSLGMVILYALAGLLLGGLGGYVNFRLAMDYLFTWRQSLSDYHAVLFTFLMITVTPQLLQAVIVATWAKKLKVLASTFVSLFIITAVLKLITVTVNIFRAADIVVFLIPAIILLTQYLLALIPFRKDPHSSSVDS